MRPNIVKFLDKLIYKNCILNKLLAQARWLLMELNVVGTGMELARRRDGELARPAPAWAIIAFMPLAAVTLWDCSWTVLL